MVRIKTECKNKAEFMSPFLFTRKQAERKIESIQQWHMRRGHPKFEIVPEKRAQIGAFSTIKGKITPFLPIAVWKENHEIFSLMSSDSLEMFRQLENAW